MFYHSMAQFHSFHVHLQNMKDGSKNGYGEDEKNIVRVLGIQVIAVILSWRLVKFQS